MAINFPSTAGQATDGTFTYVAAGITYSWNGESWEAAGSGATATDLTVFSATTASAGSTSLTYNSNNGEFTYTPPDLSSYLTSTGVLNSHIDVNHALNPTNGDLLYWNGPNLKWENLTPGPGSGLNADLLDGSHGSFYRDASNLNAGTVASDRLSGTYNISISGNAQSIPQIDSVGNVTTGVTASGQVLSYNGSNWVNTDAPSVRKTVSYTASNLNDGASIDFSFTTPNTYALLKVQTSHAAWVTLYTDTTSRTNDASRNEDTDPIAGSGVIAEVITASSSTQLITPGVIGFSSTQNNVTYAKMVNKSGTQVNLQVTLTFVPLEA